MLVLLGLLLSMLLALASTGFADFWMQFGLISLMVETVVLAASLLLCTGRGLLARMTPVAGFLVIFLVIQLLVLLFSWIALERFPLLAVADDEMPPRAFVLRNLLISAIGSLVFLRYLVLHRQWQRQVRAEASARLAALQARIRPHFLFNALNTIASLIRSRPDRAEEAVLDLSDLLRTGLRNEASHSLGQEIELIRGYLRIESLRLGDRLKVDWQIAEDLVLDVPVPALLIQPLVENAIVHGIARLPEGGTLSIEIQARQGGAWRVRIANPVPAPADRVASEGHRMALDNVRKRLALAFGDQAHCRVETGKEHFQVELRVPAASSAG